jgi:hypothetical protein
MKNKANKTDKTLEWIVGSIIVIALIFGMYLFREDVNTREYKQDNYCGRTESDANNIAAEIASYFADPDHTTLPTISGDSVYLGFTLSSKRGKDQNIAWVTGDAESTITIVVKDGSGKCPEAYQEQFPEWDSGKYTKTMD